MKTVATSSNPKGMKSNFYLSTLAPHNHHREIKFRATDAVMVIVLFLEIAALGRLFLAN
jgi:hypothetical protein